MSLKVIGTGLGRTGTYSLKLALEQLGFGKCYHMVELYQNPEGVKYFIKAEKGKSVNWNELFNGYSSAVDYPVARYYKQIIKLYPDAKVIHTLRDPESWYESAASTIFWASKPYSLKILKLAVHLPFSSTARKRIPVLWYNKKLAKLEFGSNLKDKEKVLKRYTDHFKEVISVIPKDKLLLFDAASGWEPLCRFLNVPVPDHPYPKTNTREEFVKRVEIIGSGKFISS
jgi:hypothetical protein